MLSVHTAVVFPAAVITGLVMGGLMFLYCTSRSADRRRVRLLRPAPPTLPDVRQRSS